MLGLKRLLTGTAPLLCCAAVLATTAVPAAAAWSATGSGQGIAQARTMAKVTGATATCLGPGLVAITWSPTPLATSYTVQRSIGGAPWTTGGTTTGTEYDDPVVSLSAVNIQWRVIATRSSWSGPPSDLTQARTVSSVSCS